MKLIYCTSKELKQELENRGFKLVDHKKSLDQDFWIFAQNEELELPKVDDITLLFTSDRLFF